MDANNFDVVSIKPSEDATNREVVSIKPSEDANNLDVVWIKPPAGANFLAVDPAEQSDLVHNLDRVLDGPSVHGHIPSVVAIIVGEEHALPLGGEA